MKHIYSLLLLTYMLGIQACKKTPKPKEFYKGLQLGVTTNELRSKIVSHPEFKHGGLGDYLSYSTSDFKSFVSVPRLKANEDSIVTAVSYYMCQYLGHITNAGIEEESRTDFVGLNLFPFDFEGIQASDEKIYFHLQELLKKEYKVQNMKFYEAAPDKYRYEILFAKDIDMTVKLDRVTTLKNKSPLTGRVKVTYALTEDYMKRENIKY